jgi:hypothetical protein
LQAVLGLFQSLIHFPYHAGSRLFAFTIDDGTHFLGFFVGMLFVVTTTVETHQHDGGVVRIDINLLVLEMRV